MGRAHNQKDENMTTQTTNSRSTNRIYAVTKNGQRRSCPSPLAGGANSAS